MAKSAPGPVYPAYKSPYGPKYHYQPNVAGWTPKQLTGLSDGVPVTRACNRSERDALAPELANSIMRYTGFKAGAFGGVALFAVIFYASGIPRVQQDILMKVPGLRNYFIKDVPASDNPF
ncbi:hypothetical protein JX266_009895 [Neoarthrinium moseri]|nr:hypothetical protein JX266_009895 [Neoarthrinium moseri]